MNQKSLKRMELVNSTDLNTKQLKLGLDRYNKALEFSFVSPPIITEVGGNSWHGRVQMFPDYGHVLVARRGISEEEVKAKLGFAIPLSKF